MTDVTIIDVENETNELAITPYEFSGLPLTPGSVAKVIFLCCRGNLTRSEIVERVYDYHLKNGGTDSKTDKTSTVKKALATLVMKEQIPKPVVKGYYLIGDKLELANENTLFTDDIDEITNEFQETPGAIYAYYYPSYARLAHLEGKNTWPIKIGQTDGYVSTRLLAQATAFPESPVVLYVINSKNPKLLESTIHSIYKLRGKSCYENTKDESISSGTEWFETNDDELHAILDFLGVKEEDYYSFE